MRSELQSDFENLGQYAKVTQGNQYHFEINAVSIYPSELRMAALAILSGSRDGAAAEMPLMPPLIHDATTQGMVIITELGGYYVAQLSIDHIWLDPRKIGAIDLRLFRHSMAPNVHSLTGINPQRPDADYISLYTEDIRGDTWSLHVKRHESGSEG